MILKLQQKLKKYSEKGYIALIYPFLIVFKKFLYYNVYGDNDMIPNHVAIIVDGNGRWAKKRGLPRSLGHKAGSERLEEITLYAAEKGVKYLSLYILSCDNLKRSEDEVNFLFKLFTNTFTDKKELYRSKNIRVLFSGVNDHLPESVINAMNEMSELTKNNTGCTVNFCLNYSSRKELVDAIKKIKDENVDLENIDLRKYMYQDLPDIDFLIRTSGEQRLSDFMLYQVSYAEFYFPKTLFPDFDKNEFDNALEEFNRRDRRFGGIKYEDSNH